MLRAVDVVFPLFLAENFVPVALISAVLSLFVSSAFVVVLAAVFVSFVVVVVVTLTAFAVLKHCIQ